MTSGSVANTLSTATGSLLVNSKAAYRKAYLPGSNVWVGRLLFVSSLAAVAAVLGYFTNKFLTDSETDLAEKQYESIADRALDTAAEITLRKRLGTVTMASIAGFESPNKQAWPFVNIIGYETITSQIIETSSGRGMGFCPLVTPDQLDDFEDFAYHYLESKFPPEAQAGISSFGTGVYAKDKSLNTSDNRYLDNRDGTTTWQSPNRLFAPMLQHNKGAVTGILMQNMHYDSDRGQVMDDIIECSKNADRISTAAECGVITDFRDHRPEPGSLIMQPIYPGNDTDTLTGFILSSILWSESLEGVFADQVSGVDCVLETETKAYTYTVCNGHAELKGEGDLHDTRYNKYAKSTSLTGKPGAYFSNFSASYTLTLYPNQELFQVYSTQNPYVATIGVVFVIVFTSFLFFLYDFFVRQEFNEKRSVLEAKRLFIRFVSHEVRTPLNAACMGLRLLQEEIGRTLHVGMYADSNSSSRNKNISKLPPPPPSSESQICFANDILGLSQEVMSNAESAVDILNDLLNYDKIEMGTMKLELTVVPIWDLVERTVSEFKLAATAQKVNAILDFGSLVVQPPHGGDDEETDLESAAGSSMRANQLPNAIREYRILGDTIRLTQVLRNLLSNALKFTPEGGDLTVTASLVLDQGKISGKKQSLDTFQLNSGEHVSFAKDGHCLQIQVSDTGAGMSQDQLAQLFRDGVQFNVNNLQSGQGSGIGLYISKGIVEQHGGTLIATSEGLGEGTTFTITMPIFKVPDNVLPSQLLHLQVGKQSPEIPFGGDADNSESGGGGGEGIAEALRILVVDDALTNRKLLMRLLKNRGHECDEAKDGQEAVDKVTESLQSEASCYDTILMDYEMPVMDGPTSCMEIRALGCDSYIVGITGNVLPEDVAHFRRCGANCVLPKPIQMEALEGMWNEFGVTGRGRQQQ